ncbi:MAG: type VI secretion system tube protein Hcp [Polyangiaceae bacterium]
MSLESFVRISGVKQGNYPAETDRSPHKEQFRAAVLRVDYKVYTPYDVQKHTLANERIHEPIRILKQTGPMTPLINQACHSNETLNFVEIVFYRNDPNNEGIQHAFTIKVENARIVSHRVFTGARVGGGNASGAVQSMSKQGATHDTLEMEEFEIAFRKISIVDQLSGRHNEDDWDVVYQ